MDNKLEPCPFCGGTEAFVERLDYSSSYVQCDSAIGDGCACLARGPVGVQDDDGEEIPGAAAAIAAWNRRAPAPQTALPTEGVPFPALEFPVMTYDKLGPLWDRLAMQLYALKYSDLVRAATSPAPAVVQMTDEQIECDIRSEFELWGNKYGLNAKYVQGACWDAWQSCSSIWQARMNALGAAPAADLAAAILALPLPEPEYRQEQCIKPTAYTADQMRDLISAAAALAKQVTAQEQDKIDAQRYRWLRDIGDESKPAVFIQGHWYGAHKGNGVGFDLDAAIDAAQLAQSADTAGSDHG